MLPTLNHEDNLHWALLPTPAGRHFGKLLTLRTRNAKFLNSTLLSPRWHMACA